MPGTPAEVPGHPSLLLRVYHAMPNTTAIVHTGINKIELRTTAVPEPLAGEILVKAEVSAVSPGTELLCLAGKLAGEGRFPFVPGYSMVGVVVAAGADVSIPVGQRVCVQGTTAAEGLSLVWGGHIGLALARIDEAVLLPPDVPSEVAAVAKLASLAHRGWRVANVRPGATVAVIGLGVTGMSAAAIYQARGALVVGVDISPSRVQAALQAKLPAALVDAAGIAAAVKTHFPDGVEVIVDATGSPAAFAHAVEALQPFPWDQQAYPPRVYVVQGTYAEPLELPYAAAFQYELQVLFPRNAQHVDYLGVLELALRKQIDLSPLTCAVHKPADAAKAYDLLRDRKTAPATVLFDWR